MLRRRDILIVFLTVLAAASLAVAGGLVLEDALEPGYEDGGKSVVAGPPVPGTQLFPPGTVGYEQQQCYDVEGVANCLVNIEAAKPGAGPEDAWFEGD